MYFGEYERTVDYKGRITLPSHMLVTTDDVDWGKVIILKADLECLFLYDLATWKAVLKEAAEMDDDEGRVFMHRRVSDVQPSDVDTMKRITISAPLLEHARIEKRAVVVGMFNHLELWDPEVWSRYLETMADVEVPTISDLSRARIREVS